MNLINNVAAKEQLEIWKNSLTDINLMFEKEFSPLTSQQLYYKPSTTTWSIAENMQHLIQVNESYYPIFQQLLDKEFQPAWSGRYEILYNSLGKILLKSVRPDRKNKVKTFPLWQPHLQNNSPEILPDLLSHNIALTGWMDKLLPFIGNKTVISSPANKYISYTLDLAFEIMINHEKRHFNQAKGLNIKA